MDLAMAALICTLLTIMVINARFDDVNDNVKRIARCLLTYPNENDQLHTCKFKEMLCMDVAMAA